MESLTSSDVKRICVIGAGVTGLVVLKYLNQHKGLTGTVFEQMDRVSGLWHYVEETEKDANGLPVHTAVFPSLKFNLPKELAQFTDFPFPDYENGASYLSHQNVEKYLNAYADRFNLRKNIQLNTKVLNVRPIEAKQSSEDVLGDLKTKWKVEVFNYTSNVKEEHIFDGVIVANGRFSEPVIPEIPGISEFKGSVLHTKFYRKPDCFKDQHVVMLGFGPYALDIGMEISDFAKTVTISHRKPFGPVSKKMSIINSSIAYAKTKSVVLENGDELPCDSLIFSTGYKMNFPFLHEDCGITVKDGKYLKLYRHLHSLKQPTLCFPNLFVFAPAWRVAEVQAQYLAKYFHGHIQIPSENERRRLTDSLEAEWNSKNVLPRHRLRLRADLYPYLLSLAKEAGGMSEILRNIYLFRTCLLVNAGRLFGHPEESRMDRYSWINYRTAQIYCYAGPDEDAQAEVLTLELHESTGEVHITSSLGEILNKPFAN